MLTYDKPIDRKSSIVVVIFNRIYDVTPIIFNFKLNNFLRILIVDAIKIVGIFCYKNNYLFCGISINIYRKLIED